LARDGGELNRRCKVFHADVVEEHKGVARRRRDGREHVHQAEHDVATGEGGSVGALRDDRAVHQPDDDVVRVAQLDFHPVLAGRTGGFKARRREQGLKCGLRVVRADQSAAAASQVNLRAARIANVSAVITTVAAFTGGGEPEAIARAGAGCASGMTAGVSS